MSFVSIQICWLGVPSVSFTSVFNLVASCYLSSLTLVFDYFVVKRLLFRLQDLPSSSTFISKHLLGISVLFTFPLKHRNRYHWQWRVANVIIDVEVLQTSTLTLKGCKRYHWLCRVENVIIDVEGLQTLTLTLKCCKRFKDVEWLQT